MYKWYISHKCYEGELKQRKGAGVPVYFIAGVWGRFLWKSDIQQKPQGREGESHADSWRKTVLDRRKGKNTCSELGVCFRDLKYREGTSADHENNYITRLSLEFQAANMKILGEFQSTLQISVIIIVLVPQSIFVGLPSDPEVNLHFLSL